MKKTILVTLAIASMMSCSNEEVIDSQAKQAITFDNAFVEKAPGTRAAFDGSYTTNSLTQFQVYGTITNKSGETGNIFDNVDVYKNGDVWTYGAGLQYWIPGNAYNFVATVHGNEGDAISTEVNQYHMPIAIEVEDMSVQKDILYAANGPITANATTWGETVSFIFHHLLAKAKFTVKNTIDTNSGYSYKVSDITISADKAGEYNVAEGLWSISGTDTYSLSFGHAVDNGTEEGALAADIAFGEKVESNYERLLIPTAKQLTVTFKCELFKDGVLIHTDAAKSVTTQNTVSLEKGKAYNFIISLSNPGEKIQFTVTEVKDWDTDHSGYNPGVDMK